MRRPGGIEMLGQEVERASNRGAVAGRLWREIRPHFGELAVAGGFVLVGALAQALGPYLVSRAIDRDIANRDVRSLGLTMAMLLGVYVAGAFAQRGQVWRVGAVGQKVLAEMRARLFRHLLNLPLTFFDKRPIGDLMSRVTADVDTLNQFFSQGVTQLLGAMFGLAGILVAMVSLNVRLALACYTIIPVMVFTTWAFAARARSAYRKTRRTVGDVAANLQEEIVGVRQAQAFNRTERNIERFRDRNAANRDANIAAVGVTSAFSPTIEFLSTLATALVIGYGGVLVLDDQLTVGLLAAFLIYVQQFFRPLQLAAAVYTLMQSALAGAERIYNILDEAVEPEDPPHAATLGRVAGRVDFHDVSFSYDADRRVLRNVAFRAEPGQTVAVVGRTGAGKTTLASLIPRLYDATHGSIRVDDQDIRLVTRSSLRRQMAMVLQEPFLFSGTIAENIAYGRDGATQKDVEAAAGAVHAHAFISALPKGYDTVIGESGATLSQGQRQLLALARAVVADPRILILDEATANIDTRTEALIQQALSTLLAGRTNIVIAHRLSTVRNADLILVVDDGNIAERGTHDDLMARGGMYAELYRRQFADAKASQGSRPPAATPPL